MPLTRIKSLGITDGTIVNADINASAAIASSKLTGTGKVLQVVQGDYTGTVSTTSTTYVTTNLSASITPSSTSNKILIMVSLNGCYQPNTNQVERSIIYRGGSALVSSGTAPSFGDNYSTSGGLTVAHCYQYLDSPATTSSTTYTIYFRSEGSTVYVNINGGTSFIQLLEIAG